MRRDWDKERKAAKNMTIGSCIFGIAFLVLWTAIAPSFMKLFGLIGLGMMVYRLYVILQLGKEEEQKHPKETDPWERPAIHQPPRRKTGGSCPYCGQDVEENFVFCPMCGRRLP